MLVDWLWKLKNSTKTIMSINALLLLIEVVYYGYFAFL